jgi:(E)-2-((N-methylformamido)methylene)succinate hydrolase
LARSGAAQDRRFKPTVIARNADLVERLMRQLRENHAPSYAAACTVFSTSDLGDRLHAIRAPTLIATGEHDVGSNTRMARFMQERIPGSRLEILTGLRHSILVEAPDLVARLVRDFLRA